MSKCSVKDEGGVYMWKHRTRRRTHIVFKMRTVILGIRVRVGRNSPLPSETAKSEVLVETLRGDTIAKVLGTYGFSFDDVVSRSWSLHSTMPFVSATETPTLIGLVRSASTSTVNISNSPVM